MMEDEFTYDKNLKVYTRILTKWLPLDVIPHDKQLILVLYKRNENCITELKVTRYNASKQSKYPFRIQSKIILGWMPIPEEDKFHQITFPLTM